MIWGGIRLGRVALDGCEGTACKLMFNTTQGVGPAQGVTRSRSASSGLFQISPWLVLQSRSLHIA